MSSRLLRFTLVVLLSWLLTGCGVRFVYNQLDWLIPWYLEDYVELERDQEALFGQRLQAYLAWHRTDQLPRYAAFLHQVADQAEQGLTRPDIARIEAQTEQFAQALMDRMLNDLIDLLATATDGQIEQLFARLQQDNEEYRREYIEVSADKQRKQRYKEVIKYAERWTGRLSSDQAQQIAEWVRQFELMGPEIESARLAWQDEFRRVLALRSDRPVYEAAFRKLISDPDFGRSEALKRKLAYNSELAVDLYLQLDKTLTPKQRGHMVKKLRSYADDFQLLSAQI
ncbi:DUF6279 family lipoprotein [Ketobacter sp.]|uniref:DUF6279 family lipoprotein n=1 Tax=Ketobacter sp. TaxID=2083498 RepID=UPI000F1C9AC7|nr:DUF6279 family lipoprotein [Ketobacter sp.]RLU01100.1 MAG: hypothetical protein D9N14_03890 [Ketobacter sp.]